MRVLQETATTSSQNAPKAHMLWWVRLCDILWKSIAFLGTTLILGVVASVLATWLTTSRGILPANTPLSQLFASLATGKAPGERTTRNFVTAF